MFCIKCGKEIKAPEKFCMNCGYKIKPVSPLKQQDSTLTIPMITEDVSFNEDTASKNDIRIHSNTQKAFKKKKIVISVCVFLLIVLVTVLVLLAINKHFKCFVFGHTWINATCIKAQTCSVCNATEGNPLGHSWIEADCFTPKYCSICETTEGNALEHQWQEATCITVKTCSICQSTEGNLADHQWSEATYDNPKTCSVCGLSEGEPVIRNEQLLSVASITASSQLKDTAGKTYSPNNLLDGNFETAYVEGVDGVGIGEYIDFKFDTTYYITQAVWAPGYHASASLLEKNGYPSILMFQFPNGAKVKSQEISESISLGTTVTYEFDEPIATDCVSVIIDAAIAGTKYEDTCISEMSFYGYK